jgi:hypothetical protein
MGRDRATLERFGPPSGLCLLFASLVDYWHALDVGAGPVGGLDMGRVDFLVYLFLLAVIWVLTAALTPRSRGLTRGTGYTAAAVLALGCVWDLIATLTPDTMGTSITEGTTAFAGTYIEPLLLYTGSALAVVAYCYRDIKTRRARSAHGTSDSS